MALTRASLNTPVTWASSGTKTLSFSAVPAGSFLAVVASAGDGAETFNNPTSGWSLLSGTPGTSDFKCVVYYKIADGSETSFSIDASTATGNMCGVKVTGFAGTATTEGQNENEANVTGAGVTSISTNSASNTSSDAEALAFFGSDRWDTLETSRAYTNSFTELVAATASGSRAGAWIAGKSLSGAGPNSTTFSCSDTGDQIYAAIVVVGDVVGGGTAYTKSVSGTVTPSGALNRKTARALAGSSTPAGALATRFVSLLTLTGSITPVGTLARKTARTVAGSVTAAGAIARKTCRTLAGTVTPSGGLNRKVQRALSGSVTAAGALGTRFVTQVAKAGSITISGVLSALYIAYAPFAGLRRVIRLRRWGKRRVGGR